MANYQNVVPNQLGQAALTAVPQTIYTVPVVVANSAVGVSNNVTQTTRTYLKDINICNTTAAALTVYVFIVPNSGTAAASNAIIYGKSIAANDVYRWTGSQILPASMSGTSKTTLQAYASAVGITITASGGEAS